MKYKGTSRPTSEYVVVILCSTRLSKPTWGNRPIMPQKNWLNVGRYTSQRYSINVVEVRLTTINPSPRPHGRRYKQEREGKKMIKNMKRDTIFYELSITIKGDSPETVLRHLQWLSLKLLYLHKTTVQKYP